MNGFTWIHPRDIRFSSHPDGWLAAEWGIRRGLVTAKRLFPVSEPYGMILIRDLQGGEWGVLRTADELDPSSRQALKQEIRLNAYLPVIQSVSHLHRKNQQFEWHVHTDFGFMSFHTEPLYESVQIQPDGRRVITDKSSQCYVLPAERDLDRKSIKKLRRWL